MILFTLEVIDAAHTLGACFPLSVKFHINLLEEFRDILQFLQKGYKLCMNWRLDFMQTNLLLFVCFRKGFIAHSFCKLPLHTLQSAKRKKTSAISKNMKTCESG